MGGRRQARRHGRKAGRQARRHIGARDFGAVEVKPAVAYFITVAMRELLRSRSEARQGNAVGGAIDGLAELQREFHVLSVALWSFLITPDGRLVPWVSHAQ